MLYYVNLNFLQEWVVFVSQKSTQIYAVMCDLFTWHFDLSAVGIFRGVDVYKRTVTTHSYSLPIGYKNWPLYDQLSIFFLFYWPHLALN